MYTLMVEQDIIYLNYHVAERSYRESYGIRDGTEERNLAAVYSDHIPSRFLFSIGRKKKEFP